MPRTPNRTTTADRAAPTAARRSVKRLGSVLATGLAAGALLLTSFTATAPASAAASTGWEHGAPIVTDTFKRDAASGFGAAELGGKYTTSGKGLSVSSGAGVISFDTAATARQAVLTGVQTGDAQASTTVVVPALPRGGNGVSVGLQLRSDGASYYQGTLRIAPNGSAFLGISRVDGSASKQSRLQDEVLVASALQAGSTINLDVRVHGDTTVRVAARAWSLGAATPSWQRVVDDQSDQRITKGGIGVWSYLSSATAAPASLTVTALNAVALIPGTNDTDPEPATPTTPTPDPAEPAPTTPTVPAPVDPAAPTTEVPVASAGRGSAPVGTTAYPIPSGAKYVKAGNGTSGTGTLASPYTSLAYAVATAPSGSTLVLRAGIYRESVSVSGAKKVTIEAYPNEAVWLDGSDTVTGWKKSTTGWAVGGISTNFDSGPTFTKGAPDNTAESTKFVDPAYPMAAHPEQVWVNGTAQKEVASEKAVTAGTFYVDDAGKRVVLGSDPTGKTVDVTKRQTALAVKSVGSIVRGIGVRNYGNSVYQMGAITAQANSITFENLVVKNNATIGMHTWGSGVTFANITSTGNGMQGGGANNADNLVVKNSVFSGNNVERFKRTPASGGFKISRSRTVSFINSDFQDNTSVGLWLDESVYNAKVVGNRVTGNGASGLILEISDTITVANNIIAGNARYGLWIGSTGNVQIWNNTLTGNTLTALQITQDTRRQTNLSQAGHDRRQPQPDMTVPWLVRNITVSNNVVSGAAGGCLVCVEDQSKEFTAEQMKLTLNGNLYQRASASAPSLVVRWGQAGATPKSFKTLAEFTKATGQDKRSALVDGTAVTTASYQLTPAALAKSAAISVPLPNAVAALFGQTPGAAPARTGSLLTP
ncbi:parallel beta-helix repeat (two copies) [Plantibacter flavus]|uniref:Parallel beta-helix repeat protein n=1 Tax=Plantibacter flavus TaxID=150123 RepID=A0A3N2C0C5_9MICO|nr:right-handed parallel beta-helix repeat-containing protein [Plantibacter flavus]ROR80764.1 parallel beta-helix repeat protein [Plantibacter flavus]SMG31409.1 parallel beta-helix repeat (two copies) [Plantibacter flavus]